MTFANHGERFSPEGSAGGPPAKAGTLTFPAPATAPQRALLDGPAGQLDREGPGGAPRSPAGAHASIQAFGKHLRARHRAGRGQPSPVPSPPAPLYPAHAVTSQDASDVRRRAPQRPGTDSSDETRQAASAHRPPRSPAPRLLSTHPGLGDLGSGKRGPCWNPSPCSPVCLSQTQA